MRKNIFINKFIAALILTALLISSLASCSPESYESEIPFEAKIVYEDAVSATEMSSDAENEEEPNAVTVTLQFEDSFNCDHVFDDDSTVEDRNEHRAELKEFYSAANSDRHSYLALEDYASYTLSSYAPFIVYVYDSYDAFMKSDYEHLDSVNPDDLGIVYIGLVQEAEDNATIEFTQNANLYPFADALEDIGVEPDPSDRPYTGDGIKIGIIEIGLPNDISNFSPSSEFYDEYPAGITPFYHYHATAVGSVVGGSTGVATDAQLYFAFKTDSTQSYVFNDMVCYEWFIDNDVDVINSSIGHSTGTYTYLSAYIDYIVKNAAVTVVSAIGNNNDFHTNCVANAMNVVGVTLNGRNKYISSGAASHMFTNGGFTPNVSAPGVKITSIQNVVDSNGNDLLEDYSCTGGITGTSFSSPIVAGIVALLMEQYPSLQLHPERVMAVLANGCDYAVGQTEFWDEDAGFGIINYQKSQQAASHIGSFNIASSGVSSGTTIGSISVVIPAYAKISVSSAVIFNSDTSSFQADNADVEVEGLNLNYTPVKAELYLSGSLLHSGEVVDNHSRLEYTNDSSNSITCQIRFVANETKERTDIEKLGYSYSLELHNHDYTHRYTSKSRTAHNAYCDCGSYVTEDHTMVQSGTKLVCAYCGYEMLLMK